jgi:multidrug efflux pump subunit AcrB
LRSSEPFEKRARAPEKSLQGILPSTQAKFASIHDARVLAYPFPSVRGLSTTGGVKLMVQDRGGGTPQDLESVLQASIEKGSSRPELDRVFTLFRARTPQIYADINRLQAKSRGVDVTAISETLQFYLGSVYINDLTLFGKPFQVTAQADGRFRARPEDILRLQTRNAAGEIVSLGSWSI